MKIDSPDGSQIHALRSLWKEAFGDSDEFLDIFFSTAFSADQCRCVAIDDTTAAALYLFDCSYSGRRIAYIYAVATLKAFRGRGLCSALMDDTHRFLAGKGYDGAILVPGSKELFDFYAKLGYRTCTTIGRLECTAADDSTAADLKQIGVNEYAALRRRLLPFGGVVQEKENLAFLSRQAQFCTDTAGSFVLAANGHGDTLYGIELLGDTSAASAIVRALGYKKGVFRIPGGDVPFAMYYPFNDNIMPSYFGLAFD